MTSTPGPIERTRTAIFRLGLDDELRDTFLSGLDAMSLETASEAIQYLEKADRQLPELLKMIHANGLAPRKTKPPVALVNAALDGAGERSFRAHEPIPEAGSEQASKAPKQFAFADEASFEAARLMASTAFSSVEHLTALNLKIARSIFVDGVANAKALTAAKNPQELLNLQAALVQPLADSALGYALSLYGIVGQVQAEVLNTIVVQLTKNVGAVLDKPREAGGSDFDVTFAAMKAAMAATNSAYDSMSKAAAQLAARAEARVALEQSGGRAVRKGAASKRKAS